MSDGTTGARGKLRWEALDRPLVGESAFSGNIDIGTYLRRSIDGVWVYSVNAVRTKWITKGHGEVKSAAAAKRAVERAWAAWLEQAGLA